MAHFPGILPFAMPLTRSPTRQRVFPRHPSRIRCVANFARSCSRHAVVEYIASFTKFLKPRLLFCGFAAQVRARYGVGTCLADDGPHSTSVRVIRTKSKSRYALLRPSFLRGELHISSQIPQTAIAPVINLIVGLARPAFEKYNLGVNSKVWRTGHASQREIQCNSPTIRPSAAHDTNGRN